MTNVLNFCLFGEDWKTDMWILGRLTAKHLSENGFRRRKRGKTVSKSDMLAK